MVTYNSQFWNYDGKKYIRSESMSHTAQMRNSGTVHCGTYRAKRSGIIWCRETKPKSWNMLITACSISQQLHKFTFTYNNTKWHHTPLGQHAPFGELILHWLVCINFHGQCVYKIRNAWFHVFRNIQDVPKLTLIRPFLWQFITCWLEHINLCTNIPLNRYSKYTKN